MPVDPSATGQYSESFTVSWTADEPMIYALGVGAGQVDPAAELAFTTENTGGVAQQVLPTFAAVLAQFRGAPRVDVGEYDKAMSVHGEQAVVLRRPLPASGTITTRNQVTGVYDKGSGALIRVETLGWLADDAPDAPTVTTRWSVFVRGEGGFGVKEPAGPGWAAPSGDPDRALVCRTRTDQALLYRLSGDRNPLHSDPAYAARAGFDRPILHGMCTYGVVGRRLLGELVGGDAARFVSMSARFSKPVWPGDELVVALWEQAGDRAGVTAFQVRGPQGDVVLDRGEFVVS
jgi:acyl dehydratase